MEEKKKSKVGLIIVGIVFILLIVITLIIVQIQKNNKIPNKYIGVWKCETNERMQYADRFDKLKLILKNNNEFVLTNESTIKIKDITFAKTFGSGANNLYEYKGTYLYNNKKITLTIIEQNEKYNKMENTLKGEFNGDNLTLKGILSENQKEVIYEFEK